MPRTIPMRTRRLPRCEGCFLPPPLCICPELQPLSLPLNTRIFLLMHHQERRKTTNTGRMIARILPSQTRIRYFGDPDDQSPLPQCEGPCALLFPEPMAPILSPAHATPGPLTLIVPDGTWSQAIRITRRSPDARNVPTLRLPDLPQGRYNTLRRTPHAGTLSTFEAIAHALGILEGPAIETALLRIFDIFIERARTVRTQGEIIAQALYKERPP